MQERQLPQIRKLKVALDIDGTLADVYSFIINEWNRLSGKSFKISDADDYNPSKSKLQMPLEEFLRIYDDAWNENAMEICPTVTEQELNRFANHFNVEIVTRRSSSTKDSLHKWLKHNFPSLDFKVLLVEHIKDKLKLDHDIIIDDAPQIWTSFHQNDPLTESKWLYAPYRPWNGKIISSMPPSSRMASAYTLSNCFKMAIHDHAYLAESLHKKNKASNSIS